MSTREDNRLTERIAVRLAEAIVDRGPLSIDDLKGIADVLGIECRTLLPDDDAHLRREVGASILASLADRGMTPRDLARQTGMTAGRMMRRLDGTASLSVVDLVHIARALDVEVGVLVTA